LKESTGKDAVFLKLDLADLKSIKASVEEFTSKESELHVLFNNGGVMMPPVSDLTADGYDLQFGTNVLGHFYFTKLLLPTMLSTAKNSPPNTVRIVHTSSSAQVFENTIDFETLFEGKEKNKKRWKRSKFSLYAQSKIGIVVIAREIARRYADQGIVSSSCNPGNLKTELQRHVNSVQAVVLNLILYPAHMGALTQLYAGTSPETADANGQFFIPWARRGKANKAIEDPELATKLWDWCEEQVKDI